MPLLCCEAVPSDGLCCVLRNTFAVLNHEAQLDLSACMPLLFCKSEESHSLGIILRDAATTIVVALSNRQLPKAAARHLAIPSQRKPSRFVFSNTMANQFLIKSRYKIILNDGRFFELFVVVCDAQLFSTTL